MEGREEANNILVEDCNNFVQTRMTDIAGRTSQYLTNSITVDSSPTSTSLHRGLVNTSSDHSTPLGSLKIDESESSSITQLILQFQCSPCMVHEQVHLLNLLLLEFYYMERFDDGMRAISCVDGPMSLSRL